jgi:putative transposase
MPRTARLDAAGLLHHVIIRGIEQRRIFTNDADRENFLARLEILLPETSTSCHAWSLMTNHVHLLLKTGRTPLSHFMGRLLTGYAVSYNKKHKRHGQLFQNRYKSVICEEDPYFMELVRYIHLNPLRAHIISDLKTLGVYSYTGHSAITGKHPREWQDTGSVLSSFGKDTKKSIRRYVTFLQKGIDEGIRTDLTGGGLIRSLGGWEEIGQHRNERIKSDQRILGSSDFVMKVLAEKEESLHRSYELKQKGYTLENIQKKAAELFLLRPADLYIATKEKRYVNARSILCYWAVRVLGISTTGMARHLNMTQPAITYAVKRGRIIVEKGNYNL